MPYYRNFLLTLGANTDAPDVITTDSVDLQIWYDFSDATTVNLTGGNVISVDGKGYASTHDANTSGASQRPAYLTASRNGLNTGNFDGTSDFLTVNPFTNFDDSAAAGITGYTAFYVAKFDSTSNQRLTETNATGTSDLGFGINSSGQYEYHVGGGTVVGDYADTDWHVHCFRFDGTQADGSEVTASIDNYDQSLYESSAVGDSALTDTSVVFIGSSEAPDLFFDGQVGEMIVFTRALSDADVASVHTYLQNKWGISTRTAWSPSTDITTAVWIDANDATSYTTSGSTVTAVTDKAGNYSFTVNGTPTVVSSALNSKPVFDFLASSNEDFTTTSEQAQTDGSGNHWAIGVFLIDTVDDTQDSLYSFENNTVSGTSKRDYAISAGNASAFDGELDLDGLGSNRISSTIGNLQAFDSGLSLDNYHIVGTIFNKTGNQIAVKTNGSDAFTPVNDYDNAINQNQDVRIMRNRANERTDGRVAEFFTVAGAPGTGGTNIADFQRAEGYLAHKWGLEGNLPASHPYKSSAP